MLRLCGNDINISVAVNIYTYLYIYSIDIYTYLYISTLCCVTQEGACELSEDNILSHDRFTDTADECQVMLHVSRVTCHEV